MEKNCMFITFILTITLISTSYYIVENTMISSYGFIYIFSLVMSSVLIALMVKNSTLKKEQSVNSADTINVTPS